MNDRTSFAERACPDRKEEFLNFIDDGEASEDFLKHLETCNGCQEAVEAVFDRDLKAFQDAFRVIDGGKKDELSRPVERSRHLFALVVFLAFAVVMAVLMTKCL